MLKRTEGIVLRTIPFGEADLIVTYLTPDFGIIKLFAKSPRKTKSRFGSSLEPLSLVKVFEDNYFFELKDVYGDLRPEERYYGITLSLKLDGREKSVLFKSNPRVTPPAEFAAIEKALEDLIKGLEAELAPVAE